ncbi:MAG: hypothetical protein M3Q08_04355 [Pseudomonadota bacterium]|nr:hypothetical protein [Pseudomonadota bacterium]
MADDRVSQLERLADLHSRGLLSDGEFEIAKRNLLSPEGIARGEAPQRSIGAKEWMATGAATLALLMVGAYWIGGSNTQAEVSEQPFGFTNQVGPASAEEPAGASGEEQCGSRQNHFQLKDMIFEKAASELGGDPVPLNTLKNAVSVRMEMPVVSAVDEKVRRTDCTGRLVIDLPPGTREAFHGDKSLEADLEYSFQPAADGSGSVIRAEGFGYILQRLVAAASLLNAQRLASKGGPQLQRTYNPSFDCGRSLTNVERMICQDEQLSLADRLVAAKYDQLQESLPPLVWKDVQRSQRTFLQERAECADTSCVRSAYVNQWKALSSVEKAFEDPAEAVPAAEEAPAAEVTPAQY